MGTSSQSSSNSFDSKTIVTQILQVLQPRIVTLVSQALSAQEAAATEAAAAAAAQEERRQALLIQQQQAAAAAVAAAAQESSSSSSSGSSLNALFGDGKVHYVKHEVPGQFKQEYNIGKLCNSQHKLATQDK